MFRFDPHDKLRYLKEELFKYAHLAKDLIPKVELYEEKEIKAEAELNALEELNTFLNSDRAKGLETRYERWKSKINKWKEIVGNEKLTTLSKDEAQKSLIEVKSEAVPQQQSNDPLDWYQLYTKAIDLFNEALFLSKSYSLKTLEEALDNCNKCIKNNVHFPHLYYLRGKIYESLLDEPHHLQLAFNNFAIAQNNSANDTLRPQVQLKINKISRHYYALVSRAITELYKSPTSIGALNNGLEYCRKAIDIYDGFAPGFYIRGKIYQEIAALQSDPVIKNDFLELAITDFRQCRKNFISYDRSLNNNEKEMHSDAAAQLKKIICSKIQVECDIDNTLVAGETDPNESLKMRRAFIHYIKRSSLPEVQALKFIALTYQFQGQPLLQYYMIFPGAIEFGKWMDDAGMHYSYCSTGAAWRNTDLCEQFHAKLNLKDSHNMPKPLPRVTSRDGCYNLDEEKNDDKYQETVNFIYQQNHRYGIPAHSGHKKVLAGLHGNNLDYTVLVDNMLTVIFPGEEKNALCTNSLITPHNFLLDFSNKTQPLTLEEILKLNQIFGIVGVLNAAIEMTVANGKPFLDNLFSLQFEVIKQSSPTPQLFPKIEETYTPVNFFARDRVKYFESGLEILKKYNPNLRFYGHDLLYELIREEDNRALLQAQHTP